MCACAIKNILIVGNEVFSIFLCLSTCMQCFCLYVTYDVYFILLCYFCSIFIWHVYLDKLNLELHGTLFGTLDFPDYFHSNFSFFFLIFFL